MSGSHDELRPAGPGDTAFSVRPAGPGDVETMQRIEVDAGRRFAAIGMDAIADDAPPDAGELAAHVATGTAWVAVEPERDAPVGYATASVVDGEGHLDQVSVVADSGGHGIGAALVERVCAWAVERGHRAVTLTTFRDVAWNGPWYERLGFRSLDETELGPELAAVRADERARGIDVAPRVAMRRRLAGPPGQARQRSG